MYYYDLNKISLNRGRSYINFPEWLKNKKEQRMKRKCITNKKFAIYAKKRFSTDDDKKIL